MEDLTLIKFKVTNTLFGYPQPFISGGSIVILVQEGRIQFSLYNEATESSPYPSFSHPKVEGENKKLEFEVMGLIKKKHPQYLDSIVSIVLTCPPSIAERIVW
jgi:hypothetical protein